jgi:hypothetical protein
MASLPALRVRLLVFPHLHKSLGEPYRYRTGTCTWYLVGIKFDITFRVVCIGIWSTQNLAWYAYTSPGWLARSYLVHRVLSIGVNTKESSQKPIRESINCAFARPVRAPIRLRASANATNPPAAWRGCAHASIFKRSWAWPAWKWARSCRWVASLGRSQKPCCPHCLRE